MKSMSKHSFSIGAQVHLAPFLSLRNKLLKLMVQSVILTPNLYAPGDASRDGAQGERNKGANAHVVFEV